MNGMQVSTHKLRDYVLSNKHNNETALYYLLLQQSLREKNETIVNYYQGKHNIINRYKIIEKVKDIYERRLTERI